MSVNSWRWNNYYWTDVSYLSTDSILAFWPGRQHYIHSTRRAALPWIHIRLVTNWAERNPCLRHPQHILKGLLSEYSYDHNTTFKFLLWLHPWPSRGLEYRFVWIHSWQPHQSHPGIRGWVYLERPLSWAVEYFEWYILRCTRRLQRSVIMDMPDHR